MPISLNEKFIAYLALISGLAISVVAEYYSILGLTAIFSTAVIPIVIMGIALGVGKIVATVWIKQNWDIAPFSVKSYLIIAIAILMLITSLGCFGFLSKAHSDQNLVSGDVGAKIAIYDEKIKTAKENIDVNRKALKQMDEAVDQVMGRSSDEKGADKAVVIRRSQQKERARLLNEIQAEQKIITNLNEERAPIAAEVRKVEAEVGPVKYIAAFVYGETDTTILEKAVTWVIIILIVVFDPLALILLLASQISFQSFRERINLATVEQKVEGALPEYIADDGPLTDSQLEQIGKSNVVSTATVNTSLLEQHPYLTSGFKNFENLQPMVYKSEYDSLRGTTEVEDPKPPIVTAIPDIETPKDNQDGPLFVQNEEQLESDRWSSTKISMEEYLEAVTAVIPDPSNDAPPPEIQKYIDLIKSRKLHITEVPKEYLSAVKARI